MVSKSLPSVVMVTLPAAGAGHWYQTVWPGLREVASGGSWLGSPLSLVAPKFVPVTLPEHPLITCAFAKLSFAGAGGGGGGGGGGLLLVKLYPNDMSASLSLSVITRRQPDGRAGSMIPIYDGLQPATCFQ